MPTASPRERATDLQSRLHRLLNTAGVCKYLTGHPQRPDFHPAVFKFGSLIDEALDGVALLDNFDRPEIAGVKVLVWQDSLHSALWELRAEYTPAGHHLFGTLADKLDPLLETIKRCHRDLRKLHAPSGPVAKPKATRKTRKPAKRTAHVRELTDNQKRALSLKALGMTDTEVAKEMGIERQTATEHLERGRANVAARDAAIKEFQAERSSGKSVNLDRNLPHDKRGQTLVEAPEPHED